MNREIRWAAALLCSVGILFSAAAYEPTIYQWPGSFSALIEPTEAWHYNEVWDPYVIKDSGTYYMYYTCALNSDPRGGVGRCESTDLINWTTHTQLLQATGVDGPNKNIFSPVVIKDGATWYMYCTHYYDLISSEWSRYINVYTSTDGVNWGAPTIAIGGAGKESWELYNMQVADVFKESGGDFRMFYTVSFRLWEVGNYGEVRGFLATATSSDGINWSNRQQLVDSTGDPIYAPRYDVDSLALDYTPEGIYRLLYVNSNGDLQVATSSDGVNWTEVVDPVIDYYSLAGFIQSPDVTNVKASQLFRDDDDSEYLMFSISPSSPINETIGMVTLNQSVPVELSEFEID